MTKDNLLKEIQEDKEDAYTIFCKGYLNHFDMDSDIFNALLPKLLKEAEALQAASTQAIESPETLSDSQAEDLSTKADNFYKLIYNACEDEVIDIPYISECSRILWDTLHPSFVDKVNAKINEGYKFVKDVRVGFFIIKDDETVVFSSPFIPAKTILKEFGVDVDHPMYPLFYFGLFPKDDLDKYRLSYCFYKHFHLG